jgi:cytochrome c-type biogenesis protein CcmE
MTARQTRLAWLAAALIVISVIAIFVVNALRENMVFFYTPTEMRSGAVQTGQYVRIGGIVAPNSIVRQPDGVSVWFDITDNGKIVPVAYQGMLPDLFQEGKGAVAQGRWNGELFTADEVLAKHDENYMPPEAQEAIDRHASLTSAKSGER